MSVPAPRDKSDGGRWETVRYAIGSNARTIRFCLIVLITILGPFAGAATMHLVLHLLLPRGQGFHGRVDAQQDGQVHSRQRVSTEG